MIWGDEVDIWEDPDDDPSTFGEWDGPETIALGTSEAFGDTNNE